MKFLPHVVPNHILNPVCVTFRNRNASFFDGFSQAGGSTIAPLVLYGPVGLVLVCSRFFLGHGLCTSVCTMCHLTREEQTVQFDLGTCGLKFLYKFLYKFGINRRKGQNHSGAIPRTLNRSKYRDSPPRSL